jgi:L-ascorbate metabolism protein UlaG (beta-lactamase superfamily)
MKLTKYQHACFTVEDDGKILIVDPGNFTSDFIAPENVVAVVVTHEHPDHFDHEQLAAIIDKNPDAVIVGHEAVVSQIEVFETKAVRAGDTLTIGPFSLEFFGGEHALIYKTMPVVANLGVMVNDLLYYPGDSFTTPGKPVDTLAVPASAPWMKMSEAMDFLADIKPRFAFPTHDAILSDIGKSLSDRLLGNTATTQSTEYKRLESPVEI